MVSDVMCYTIISYMLWNIRLRAWMMVMMLILFMWIFAKNLTVFHSSTYILFKLKAYSISGNILNWIMDFVSNR